MKKNNLFVYVITLIFIGGIVQLSAASPKTKKKLPISPIGYDESSHQAPVVVDIDTTTYKAEITKQDSANKFNVSMTYSGGFDKRTGEYLINYTLTSHDQDLSVEDMNVYLYDYNLRYISSGVASKTATVPDGRILYKNKSYGFHEHGRSYSYLPYFVKFHIKYRIGMNSDGTPITAMYFYICELTLQ